VILRNAFRHNKQKGFAAIIVGNVLIEKMVYKLRIGEILAHK
jgi:hypothetical protein